MKLKKSALALIVASSVLSGMIIGASGAELRETITATLRRDLNVEVDGVKQTLKDANGDVVYPITYNNSTYVPFRAVGDLLDGVTVDWDQDTQTAKYITSGTAKPETPSGDKVDLIDDIEPQFDGWSQPHVAIVPSSEGQRTKVDGQVLDHWLRFDLMYLFGQQHCYVWYDLPGEHDSMTFTTYSSYDVTVTVYDNYSKDRVLAAFDVKANAEPTTQTVQIDGAVQVRVDIVSDQQSGENDHAYIYDAYLQ